MEIVTGALPSLLPKLADLLSGEYNLQMEVKGGIKFLQTELETMKAALEDISLTPAGNLCKVDKIWARDVRELSYDIEDKIDTFMVRCKDSSSLAGAGHHQHGLNKAIDRSLNWLMQPKIRRKIATDIRHIKSCVEEVSKRRDRYKIINTDDVATTRPIMVDPRVLARYEKRTELIGIHEARDDLIKMMMEVVNDEACNKEEKVLSIVGLGGLGKTTLANEVYENLRTQFDHSAFVSVSQTPDLEKILKDMMYQLAHRNNVRTNVLDELRRFLLDKRYFIVIDDIWDISVWKMIRYALPENMCGCKIITTTRILKVAEEVGGPYKMKPLCLHDSRILFFRRIFGNKDNDDKCPDEELVEVSNRILIKCAGVPLAIITMASLLATKRRNKLDWYEVDNSIGKGMESNTDVENMRKILSLSYYNLPSQLRTCLLYLSVFTEDYEIDKNSLIWMWMAEGFIQCGNKQGHRLFTIGENYFNELVNRSMIQPVYGTYDMMLRSCRVHDMVLDLIRSLSSEENFITTLNDVGHTSPPQNVRRLSLQNDKVVGQGMQGETMGLQQVRSVVVFSSVVDVIPALSRFKVLRVLHLENCDLSDGYNLKSIGKLVHLRCLGLRSTNTEHLPEEIGNLHFLEMLDISNNYIFNLPFSIVQLTKLKCLYIDTVALKPNSLGRLTSLEELSLLHIHTNATQYVEKLGHLTELRVLHITYYGIDEPRDVLVDCLHKLQKIETLSIEFLERTGTGDMKGWLVGPRHLRSLQIVNLEFPRLPVWINFSNVQDLSFLEISVEELLPEDLEMLGRLPALRCLFMHLGNYLTHINPWEYIIGAAACSFPCLVGFKLLGCYERVVFRQGAMPCLTSLELDVSRAVWSEWTTTKTPDLGFENLSLLRDLRVGLRGGGSPYPDDAAEATIVALRNMAEILPNHPSISVFSYGYCRTDDEDYLLTGEMIPSHFSLRRSGHPRRRR